MEQPNNQFIDKLVGLPKDQEHLEHEWHRYIIEQITQIGGKKIEEFEIEKTSNDIALIHFAEKSADNFLKEYGRDKQITVPIKNIHVLKEHGTEEYTEGHFSRGAHSSTLKSILIDRNPSDTAFSLTLFHELMHLKSYTALQVLPSTEEDAAQVRPYRNGIAVVSRDGKTTYLNNLEEAIIGYATEQFYNNSVKINSLFKDEKFDVSIDTSRREEVEKLYTLVDMLFQKNQDSFSSKEEVLGLFIHAQANGDLFKVGRLIEKTLGEGTLKKLDATILK
ncbi:MAG: hypothetical protein BGO70_01055 [Bacteroidetes bacterium 43-93]|uniref:hypothetical protein n=1 Tax=uncultured Dysgonomonas sp. TaxID=206096 RepID=UPI0009294193|nr:hypothetical protein [uncultured Dysgonomonas sp.]MBN9483134.1 hypothetical protein [Bacteroidota bacterium]OJW96300.1 MAG: hypothetical protein BGO70_01055 [Bacteroidetes bacterium 43-93]